MSAGGQDKAAYRAAGPGKMGFKKGAYGSAKGVRAKAANLSDAQLKRAGALKASKKAAIDITQTRREEGSGVTLGPKGKPLTGSVKLANGKTAVYKAGKRVVNKPVSKDKPKPPPAKTLPLNMQRNAPGGKSSAKASAKGIAAYKAYKATKKSAVRGIDRRLIAPR